MYMYAQSMYCTGIIPGQYMNELAVCTAFTIAHVHVLSVRM